MTKVEYVTTVKTIGKYNRITLDPNSMRMAKAEIGDTVEVLFRVAVKNKKE